MVNTQSVEKDEINRLVRAIPHGREKAVRRSALVRQLGMSDRRVRLLIEEARREGHIILNQQTGEGYYISEDLDEMEKQYRQDTARAMAILSRRKPLRDALKAAGRDV